MDRTLRPFEKDVAFRGTRPSRHAAQPFRAAVIDGGTEAHDGEVAPGEGYRRVTLFIDLGIWADETLPQVGDEFEVFDFPLKGLSMKFHAKRVSNLGEDTITVFCMEVSRG